MVTNLTVERMEHLIHLCETIVQKGAPPIHGDPGDFEMVPISKADAATKLMSRTFFEKDDHYQKLRARFDELTSEVTQASSAMNLKQKETLEKLKLAIVDERVTKACEQLYSKGAKTDRENLTAIKADIEAMKIHLGEFGTFL